MRHTYSRVLLAGMLLLAALPIGASNTVAAPTQASQAAFADPAFQTLWNRTDYLVANKQVARSYYWGPQPNTGPLSEEYIEGPGGKHMVQYFDKSRMEINNPNADRNNPFFVTNGLLTVELITGRMQLGNFRHVNRWRANIPLASDTDDANAPTYANFASYMDDFTPEKLGELVQEPIGKANTAQDVARYAGYNVKYFFFVDETEHNIPDVFWNFLNQTGPIYAGGKVSTAQLSSPWFYTTGYPITEAYWASVKIAGKPNTDVLIQPYERRVLTYVPSAPEGFKVQMGNIGQHYYDWRYKDAGKPSPLPSACTTPPLPNSRFGQLWQSSIVIQHQLQCPAEVFGGLDNVTMVTQPFERGRMIYIGLTQNPPRTSTPSRLIYVLLDNATVRIYPDRDPSTPEPTPEPAPSGMFTPVLGFGHVWRTNNEVKPLLGYATGPERTVPPSDYQFFTRGIMLADGGKIYEMHTEEFFYFAYANTWSVYDDPSQ